VCKGRRKGSELRTRIAWLCSKKCWRCKCRQHPESKRPCRRGKEESERRRGGCVRRRGLGHARTVLNTCSSEGGGSTEVAPFAMDAHCLLPPPPSNSDRTSHSPPSLTPPHSSAEEQEPFGSPALCLTRTPSMLVLQPMLAQFFSLTSSLFSCYVVNDR